MKIIGIDGFEVYVKFGREEYSWMVKKLANMDVDRSEDDS